MALVKYNNNSLSAITAAAAIPSGAMTLIKSQTASSASTLSFVHGTSDVVLNNTYPIYLFKLINIHPSAQAFFGFNFSIDAFIAGYCNTASAIDGVQFNMDSGNIDAGTFKLYGVS